MLIGILQIILTSIGAVTTLVALTSSEVMYQLVESYCGTDYNDTLEFCQDDPAASFRISIGIYLGICILGLIVAAALVHGARTRNPSLLLPWIIMTGLSIIINIVVNIYDMAVIGSEAIAGAIISIAITVVISGYFYLVVTSYRKELINARLNGNADNRINVNQFGNNQGGNYNPGNNQGGNYNPGNQYASQQFGKQPSQNPQFGNQQYGNPQYGNSQYGNPQYGTQQYGNPSNQQQNIQPPAYESVAGNKY